MPWNYRETLATRLKYDGSCLAEKDRLRPCLGDILKCRTNGLLQRQNPITFLARHGRPAKMFRAGLYARVSTNDQQTLAMQSRAMREYAARRGWTIAVQVREVNSGAARARSPRETTGGRAPPGDRCRAGLAAGPLGPVGNGSAGNTPGTGASRRRLRVADRGAGPDHARRSRDGWSAGDLRRVRKGDSAGTNSSWAWPMRGRTGNGWVGRQPRPCTLPKSGNSIAPASANPRSPAGCRSAAPPSAGLWRSGYYFEKS